MGQLTSYFMVRIAEWTRYALSRSIQAHQLFKIAFLGHPIIAIFSWDRYTKDFNPQTFLTTAHVTPKKKPRRNASVGQKIWREARISSLFVWRHKRWRPCGLCISGCSCAGLPIFQLRIASMSGAVADIDFFFFGFVSREESVAFFFGEGSQTRPQCAAMHSSFDTERKFAAFPKLVVLTFFFICSVFKRSRC